MPELKNPENPVVARIHFELANAQRSAFDPVQETEYKCDDGHLLQRDDVLRIVEAHLKEGVAPPEEQWSELAKTDLRLRCGRDSLERLAARLIEENSALKGDLDRHAAHCECPDKGEWW